MNDSTRRRFLQLSGVVATVGVGGCSRLTGGNQTPTPANQDTDGDGVIDSEDYAPRDPDVQREEQIRDAKSTQTDTAESESTPAPEPYEFESLSGDDWTGDISFNSVDAIVDIEHDGTAFGASAEFGQAVRTEPLGPLPQSITFEATFTRNSLENNVEFGITGDPEYQAFSYSNNGHITILNTERRSSSDRFALFVTEGNQQDPIISDSFLVTEPEPMFELQYDGTEATAVYGGDEVASLDVTLDTPLYGAVSLEDDPDTTEGDMLTLTDYSETSL